MSEKEQPESREQLMELTEEEYEYIEWLRALPEDERQAEIARIKALARKRMH